MLGVRLDPEMEQRLLALTALKKRTKSYLAKEALLRYIEEEEINERRKQETLESWQQYQETGITIDGDDMLEWLESWGTENEKPCPSSK
jgi:predicted transcriptional regulator